MTSPADQLLAAADLIRDTAARATQGTWSAKDMAEHGHSGVWWVEAEHRDADGTTWGTVADLETTNPKNDARWIALMSPAVAPKIESVLRDAGHCYRVYERGAGPVGVTEVAALALAKAVLGIPEETT